MWVCLFFPVPEKMTIPMVKHIDYVSKQSYLTTNSMYVLSSIETYHKLISNVKLSQKQMNILCSAHDHNLAFDKIRSKQLSGHFHFVRTRNITEFI